MLPLGKAKTPQQVISSRVCHLRTILLPLYRMTDSRDKMVLLCCGNAKGGGEGGERVMEKWNTLWKQACTRKKTKPSGPARASSYPNTQQKGGKTNNHKKKKLNPNPLHFSVFHFHMQYIAEDQSHFI